MAENQVSIIILNWNNRDVIEDCLESALAQVYSSCEVILVDNGSSDGSLERVRSRFGGRIKIVENGRNLGFAGGVNSGIRNSRGAYVALLNSDAMADRTWIQKMVERLEARPEAGMAACKTYLAGREGVLDNTGEVLYRDGLNRARGRLETDRGQYDASEDVLCPSGCAALFRREVFEKAGEFEEMFFIYGEDMEMGLRARMLGYGAVYVPSAVVTHRLSHSEGALSVRKAYFVERNRLWLAVKLFPLPDLLASFYYTLKRYLYHASGLAGGKGPAAGFSRQHSVFHLLWIVIKVQLTTVWHLPMLLSKRFAVRKKSRWTRRDFQECFKRYGISARDAALGEVV